MNDPSRYRKLFLLLPFLVLVLEILGYGDLSERSFSGYTADDNNVIVSVVPGSPADRAGIRIGDRMKLLAGVDTKNTGALLRLPRPAVGETRTYVLERSDSTVRAHVTFSGLPQDEVNRSILYAVVGFAFLAIGFWAFLAHPTPATMLLALICFSAAIDFIHHPYLSSYELRIAYMLVLNMIVFTGYALLLHLVLLLPSPSPFLVRRASYAAIYGPAALLTLLFLAVIVFASEQSGWLVATAYAFYALFFIGYLGITVGVLVSNYLKATPQERRRSGLNTILLGTLLGLGPILIAAIVRSAAPATALPGADYYIIPVVLLPLAFAVVTTRTPGRPPG